MKFINIILFFYFYIYINIINGSDININLIKSREQYANDFKQALSFKTVSYDSGDNQNQIDYNQYRDFINFLNNKFPLIHLYLNQTIINKYSIIYKWQGSNSNIKPLFINAHYDVVPIEQNKWNFNGFGEISGDIIYGRGSIDNKLIVMSSMEAIEAMLKNGYLQPTRTIYLCFGHDEEIGGLDGHAMISRYFYENQIFPEAIIDEGAPILGSNVFAGSNFNKMVAAIGISEKGYLYYRLVVDLKSTGHSSVSNSESAIAILSKALVKIDSNQFESVDNIESTNQFLKYFSKELIGSHPLLSSFTKTTTTLTIIRSGDKVNVAPSSATAWVSHRIVQGNSIEYVKNRILSIINDTRIKMEVDSQLEPSPISSTSSYSYQTLKDTIEHQFTGYNLIVSPIQLIANTDTRHYWNLTSNIFRITPALSSTCDISTIHGNNEGISIDEYIKTIHFYKKLILNFNKFNSTNNSNNITSNNSSNSNQNINQNNKCKYNHNNPFNYNNNNNNNINNNSNYNNDNNNICYCKKNQNQKNSNYIDTNNNENSNNNNIYKKLDIFSII